MKRKAAEVSGGSKHDVIRMMYPIHEYAEPASTWELQMEKIKIFFG